MSPKLKLRNHTVNDHKMDLINGKYQVNNT